MIKNANIFAVLRLTIDKHPFKNQIEFQIHFSSLLSGDLLYSVPVKRILILSHSRKIKIPNFLDCPLFFRLLSTRFSRPSSGKDQAANDNERHLGAIQQTAERDSRPMTVPPEVCLHLPGATLKNEEKSTRSSQTGSDGRG